MAKAFIGEVECQVLLDRDLGDSWAVTVKPPPSRPGEPLRVPLIVKLQGNGPQEILKGALETLQKSGAIDRFEL